MTFPSGEKGEVVKLLWQLLYFVKEIESKGYYPGTLQYLTPQNDMLFAVILSAMKCSEESLGFLIWFENLRQPFHPWVDVHPGTIKNCLQPPYTDTAVPNGLYGFRDHRGVKKNFTLESQFLPVG